MPDTSPFQFVRSIPKSADNNLVPYDQALAALRSADRESDTILLGPFSKSETDKIVRTFKQKGGTKVVTRQNRDDVERRDIYVRLDSAAPKTPPAG